MAECRRTKSCAANFNPDRPARAVARTEFVPAPVEPSPIPEAQPAMRFPAATGLESPLAHVESADGAGCDWFHTTSENETIMDIAHSFGHESSWKQLAKRNRMPASERPLAKGLRICVDFLENE